MATGDPTGADLASGTTDGNTLPQVGTWEEREITLGAGVALTSGTKYAIVVRAASATPGDDIHWISVSGNGYANGNNLTSDDSGSSWTSFTAWDSWFKTKASAVEKDIYTPGGEGSFDNFSATDWVAQSFTASSSYTITSVILKMQRFTGVSPGAVTVGIRVTESGKAINPSPSDANTSVTLDQATISWDDGGSSDTFDVYYGTESGNLIKVSDAQVGTSFTVTGITDGSPYAYLSVRYWRIDSTNAAGTTTGDEWSFTTLRLDPPSQTYFYPTTGQYYYLLIQDDGSYGDPPGTGVENVDFVYLAAGYEANFVATNRKLVAIAENRFWYEDL